MADKRLRLALDAWEESLFPREGGKDVLLKVIEAYGSPGRYYHTLQHLAEMTELLCEFRAQLPNFTSAICACLWHDIVYDATRADNEEQSCARWLDDADRMALRPAKKERVAQLILATQKHQPADGGSDMAIFLDADLAVLGSEKHRYEQYLNAIRYEYAHVPEPEYRAGRTAVLKKFLDRPQIYFSAALRERFEARARGHLTAEIAALAQADSFRGTYEQNASGLLTWSVYGARAEIMQEITPHLQQQFGFTAFSEPIWSPDSIIGECSAPATTLKWGWDVFSGFYFFSAEKSGDALVQKIGDYLNGILGGVEFNLYRTYILRTE